MVSCRFSLKPIHWFINLYHVISRITTNHSFPLAQFLHILTRSTGFCDARPLSWSDLPDRSDLPRKSQNIHPQPTAARCMGSKSRNHNTIHYNTLYVNICIQCYVYIYIYTYCIYNSPKLMKLGKELEGKSLSWSGFVFSGMVRVTDRPRDDGVFRSLMPLKSSCASTSSVSCAPGTTWCCIKGGPGRDVIRKNHAKSCKNMQHDSFN